MVRQSKREEKRGGPNLEPKNDELETAEGLQSRVEPEALGRSHEQNGLPLHQIGIYVWCWHRTGALRLAASVWALRYDWGGLTATGSDIGGGRALLSDEMRLGDVLFSRALHRGDSGRVSGSVW